MGISSLRGFGTSRPGTTPAIGGFASVSPAQCEALHDPRAARNGVLARASHHSLGTASLDMLEKPHVSTMPTATL